MREDIQFSVELKAEDTLGVELLRLSVEVPGVRQPAREVLRRQAQALVDQVTYMEGPLAVIEVDGVSNSALIRSRNPTDGRFVQFILRGGGSIRLEAVGGALHLSRENYEKLLQLLQSIVS